MFIKPNVGRIIMRPYIGTIEIRFKRVQAGVVTR